MNWIFLVAGAIVLFSIILRILVWLEDRRFKHIQEGWDMCQDGYDRPEEPYGDAEFDSDFD
jgi:hypothetical protein